MSASKTKSSMFRPPRVATAQTVINFQPDDDIVLKLGSDLLGLAKKLKGEIISPSIPDQAPPDAPRVVVKGANTTVTISLTRAVVSVTPPSHVRESFDSASQFSSNSAIQALEIFARIVAYKWSGVVVDLEYAARTTDQKALALSTPFFDSIVNIKRNDRQLASFQLAIGFTERGFNRNYNLSGYDTREILIQKEAGRKWAEVDLDKHPISEAGMKIRVDINNRGRGEHVDQITEIKELWEEHKVTFEGLEEELGIGDLIR